MFVPQTLKDYLNNPMGKGSTALTNLKIIKSDLDSRYEKLLKDNKDFEHTVYRDGNQYYFHIKIPSESERENDYDVVIQFYIEDKELKYDNFLNRYYVRFFSNCPSFVFTYAYVYNENDYLIKALKNKYTDIVLKDSPVVRNPAEIINFEKSVYFAAKYIQDHNNLRNKMFLKSIEKKYDPITLNRTVRTSDKILLEIKKENRRLSDEKKKKEEENKKKNKTSISKKITGAAKQVSSVNKNNNRVNKIKPKAKIKPTKSTVKKK